MRALVLILSLMLGGCVTIAEVHDKGVQVADDALDIATVGTCDAPTVGAAWRKFGGTPERWCLYQQFCGRYDALCGAAR